jgi:murein DD-endopeptidase MepM/ murein hydrolase activator NlpD
MKHRRWTLLLIPEGNERTRTISFSTRAIRTLVSFGSVFGSVAMLGVGVSVARFAAPNSLIAGRDPKAVHDEVIALRARIDSLGDTLAAITKRNDQIRMLAGLPSPDSTPTLAGARPIGADATPAPGAVDGLIRRANTLAASFAEVSDTLIMHAERYERVPSIMPTAGWLSSNFSRSRFHPILHINRPHEGIDVSAPFGAPIIAPAAGTVIRVTTEHGYGQVLEIDHGNGIVTKFAHCSKILVHTGQHVNRGDPVANVGNSGLSTGPHLHYEIHINGKVVNPLTYVLSDAIPD